MGRTVLLNASGSRVQVDESESVDVTVTMYDNGGSALAKASISAITMTLYNDGDKSIINSRENANVLDATIGTVTSAGVLTLKLTTSDNAMIDSNKEKEVHVIALTWTWTDGAGVSKTGKQEFEYEVFNHPTTVSSPTSIEPGWMQ